MGSERFIKIMELSVLLSALENKQKATGEELTQLFNLHNYFNPQRSEYARHCTSCVERTYKTIKNIYYSTLINEMNVKA